ncbi:hypothetical protein BKA65DRAFT_514755, partial [Rhexocercosporidium sp. MPI-PUGE-AT-0058]
APQYPLESPDLRAAPSNYSIASGPSATSSTMGSPHSIHGHVVPVLKWAPLGLGLNPSIIQYDKYSQGNDYSYQQPTGIDDFALEFNSAKPSFVNPSILHPQYAIPRSTSATQSNDTSVYPPPTYPRSPLLSHMSRSPRPMKQGSQSPYSYASLYPYLPPRRPSIQSYDSQDGNFSSEESKEKGRCTYPECGKVFKDLKAHMLTHQIDRPEKCSIQTCDYHIKGFARKYDKNRHTLTHYKGTMVCGFCPGSGSAAEKSFNRADIFKRHLTSVHAVEQTPPNSRKKTSGNTNSAKKLSSYTPDATGKCSTCSGIFSNAQDFYEHLDDCVLRIMQQKGLSNVINGPRLAEVEQNQAMHKTLRNNTLSTAIINAHSADENADEENFDDENDGDFSLYANLSHKGDVTQNSKGRKKRKNIQPDEEAMMRKQQKRALEGSKQTAFLVRGRPVDPEKINRYLKVTEKREHPNNTEVGQEIGDSTCDHPVVGRETAQELRPSQGLVSSQSREELDLIHISKNSPSRAEVLLLFPSSAQSKRLWWQTYSALHQSQQSLATKLNAILDHYLPRPLVITSDDSWSDSISKILQQLSHSTEPVLQSTIVSPSRPTKADIIRVMEVMSGTLGLHIAPLPWACVCILMQLFNSVPGAEKDHVPQLSEIVSIIARYAIMENMYRQNPSMSLRSDYRTSLLDLCTLILRFFVITFESLLNHPTEKPDLEDCTKVAEEVKELDHACQKFMIVLEIQDDEQEGDIEEFSDEESA